MDDSDSSSILSDPPSSVEEPVIQEPQKKIKLNVTKSKQNALKQSTLSFASRHKVPSESPEPPLSALNREPSPPHDYVLADNPNIAVIVMFQSRFNEAFLPGVPNLGPQDIEQGVVPEQPSPQVEELLCGLLGLVLNRKKNPERGHYGRALEEALATQKYQWPPHWQGVNPVPSSKTFASLAPERRIDLLKTLVHWSLTASEAIAATIRDNYKGTRNSADNVLDVPAWGQDSLKRKFYLIEGLIDTPTRVYREGDRRKGEPTWQSVAGGIADVQNIARSLRVEQSQAAHGLADRMMNHVKTLEVREDKQKRKQYRQSRKAFFSRPEPGMSLYEGRTRGKRPRYTYDDDEIYGTDSSTRRSARQSGVSTPADGPRYTASGRQVRSTYGASYGETVPGGDRTSFSSVEGRPTRSGRVTGRRDGIVDEGYDSAEELDEDGDSAAESGEDWDGNDEDGDGEDKVDDEHDASDADSEDSLALESTPRSLVVKLKCGPRLQGLVPKEEAPDSSPSGRMDIDSKPPIAAEGPEIPQTHAATLPLSPRRPMADVDMSSPTPEHRLPPSFSQYAYNQPSVAAAPPVVTPATVKTEQPSLPTPASTNASQTSQINGVAAVNGFGSDRSDTAAERAAPPVAWPQSSLT